MRPRGWLLLLSLFLFLREPLRLAVDLGGSAGTLSMRGPLAVVELCAHAAVAVLAVAAAWALRIGNPEAPRFAAAAIAASAAVSVQSLYWSVLPDNTVPADRLPLTVIAVAHAAGWIAYLRRSRRVRAVYG